MTPDIYDFVHELADGCTDASLMTAEAASAMLERKQCSRSTLLALAAEVIAEEARDMIRRKVVAAEERARRGNPPISQPRITSAYSWKDDPGTVAAIDRNNRNMWDSIHKAVATYSQELRMEWTAELLAMSFAVDQTGRTATWGDATVADHEARIAMLESNAAGNMEAAARHAVAVSELRAAGAPCLSQLIERVAA